MLLWGEKKHVLTELIILNFVLVAGLKELCLFNKWRTKKL